MRKDQTGKWGEAEAVTFLKHKKYKIVGTNYHSRFGEIDIVAKDNETLVFVEVKTRTTNLFGFGAEAVGSKKIARLIKTIDYFLNMKGWQDKPFRVDVVEVSPSESGVSIHHDENVTL